MQGFKVGGPKKSRLQLHREAEAAKKRKAEEEAAQVYADFVESFESDNTGAKEFVKAGTAQDGKYTSTKQERYLPGGAPAAKLKKPNIFAALDEANEVSRELSAAWC